jgi:hypothetical protein
MKERCVAGPCVWPEERKQGGSPGSHHSFRPNGRQKWYMYWMWRVRGLSSLRGSWGHWKTPSKKGVIAIQMYNLMTTSNPTQFTSLVYFWFRISHLLDLFLRAAVHTHIHGICASKRIPHMQDALLTCSQAPFVNMNIVNIKGGRCP